MTPDEDFTPEMKARAMMLSSDFQHRVDDMWYEYVVGELEREFNINTEAAEVLAATYGV